MKEIPVLLLFAQSIPMTVASTSSATTQQISWELSSCLIFSMIFSYTYERPRIETTYMKSVSEFVTQKHRTQGSPSNGSCCDSLSRSCAIIFWDTSAGTFYLFRFNSIRFIHIHIFLCSNIATNATLSFCYQSFSLCVCVCVFSILIRAQMLVQQLKTECKSWLFLFTVEQQNPHVCKTFGIILLD